MCMETVSGDFNQCSLDISCKYKFYNSHDAKYEETTGSKTIDIKISKLDKREIEDYAQSIEEERVQDSIMLHGGLDTWFPYMMEKKIKNSTACEKDEYITFDTTIYKISLKCGSAINDITDD